MRELSFTETANIIENAQGYAGKIDEVYRQAIRPGQTVARYASNFTFRKPCASQRPRQAVNPC